MEKKIKLTEGDINNIVKMVLKEMFDNNFENKRQNVLIRINGLIGQMNNILSEYAKEFGEESVLEDDKLSMVYDLVKNYGLYNT